VMGPVRISQTACAVGLLCLMSATALAQKAPAVPTEDELKNGVAKAIADDPLWLEPIIQRLDSDDLKVRDRASVDLRTDPKLSLDQLQARIADHSRPLTPEQLLRMNQVAVALFRETPRAAMGVSFARIVPGGVELGLVIDQFDARRVLRVGDVIAEMGGIPIVSLDDARAVIVSHDPGDEMKVIFSRGGEPQQGVVRLGSFRELQNAYNLNDSILREAWVIRCDRLAQQGQQGQPQAAPIEAGITHSQWVLAKTLEDAAVNRRMRQDAEAPPQEAVLDGADVLVGGGALRPLDEIPLLDFAVNGQRRIQSPDALRIQQEIDNYQQQLRNIDQRLRQGNLNEAQRRAFMQSSQHFRGLITRKRAEQQKLIRDEAKPLLVRP